MATVLLPDTQKSQGYTRLIAIPTGANLASLTVAELTGATAQVLSCHMYGDFTPTATENVGEGPRKMCSRKMPQQFGSVAYTINELSYSHLPQEDDEAPGNEARATLTPGTTQVLVEFPGIDGQDGTVSAGQKYVAHRVELGLQRKSRTSDDEFGEFNILQSAIYANGGEPVEGAVSGT